MNCFNQFDSQLQKLINVGYPSIAGMTNEEFTAMALPLREKLSEIEPTEIDLEKGVLPFVLVVTNRLISAEKAMNMATKDGKSGVTKLNPLTSQDFQVISQESIPVSPMYLLVDVDRGKDTLNVAPEEAMNHIVSAGRHPLTIDEGISILIQFPEFLKRNNCFSLLASRHEGDKRVPAIWINGADHPNLGWCWNGNPHTWLGSASAKYRIGY